MNILLSFAHRKYFLGLHEYWRMPLIMDSGAFTAHASGVRTDLTEYIEFCRAFGLKWYGYIQLDAIGDRAATARNLDAMVAAGLKPMPVLTTDEDPRAIREFVAINRKVCIAGGPFMATPAFIRRARLAYEHASAVVEEPLLHGLGFTRCAPAIAPSGLKTVDSTSWAASSERYGNIAIYRKETGDVCTRREKPGLAALADTDLMNTFIGGPPVTTFGKKTSGRLNWRFITSCRSYLRMAERLRRSGVKMFFAMEGRGQANILATAAATVASDWRTDWPSVGPTMDVLKAMSGTDFACAVQRAYATRIQGQVTA